jgi:DME family drug/metabolite transporter
VFAIVVAALLWGTVGIATRTLYGIADTNALSIGFFRLALSVPPLLVACRWALGPGFLRVRNRRDLGLMALMGAMMALYQVCYFAAIAQVGVAIAVLVTLCTAPVLVAVLSALLLRERLRLATLVALGLALGGTALLVLGQEKPVVAGGNPVLGVALAMISTLGYAVVTLCSRSLAGRYHPLQPITVGFGIGALTLLPFALATGLALHYSPAGWALLLHLGLVPTAFAYSLFLYGMRTSSATIASIVTLLEPLTSTLLAWWLFGERLGPYGLVGGLLMVGAIGLVLRAEARG